MASFIYQTRFSTIRPLHHLDHLKPPRFVSLAGTSYNVTKFTKNYFMWLLLRKQNAFDQVIPYYYGWAFKNRARVKGKL